MGTSRKESGKVKVDPRFAGLFADPELSKEFIRDTRSGKSVEKGTLYNIEDSVIIEDRTKEAMRAISMEKNEIPSIIQPEADDHSSEESYESDVAEVCHYKENKENKEDKEDEEGKDNEDSEDSEEDEDDETSDDDDAKVYREGRSKFVWNEESSDSDDDEDIEIKEKRQALRDAAWGKREHSPLTYGDSSKRLAILGCDWDNINSTDIFVLCRSFLENEGDVIRVDIYKSDFGHTELEYSRINGPRMDHVELMKNKKVYEGSSKEVPEEVSLAIRKYERDRSLYYYAVVEFNSITAAELVFGELDDMDAEFAVDNLDVRFVPDSITEFPFSPESSCTAVPKGYRAPGAFRSSLKHSSAKFLFDETPKKRTHILRKKFTAKDMNELDIQEYLGSDEESDVDEERIAAMRALLLGNEAARPLNVEIEQAENISEDNDQLFTFVNGEVVQSSVVKRNEPITQQVNQDRDRKKSSNRFALLTGDDDSDSELLIEPDLSDSDDERSSHQIKSKLKGKNKAKAAMKKHKAQKEAKSVVLNEAELIVKSDKRFAEFSEKAEHFIDATERKRLKRS